MNKSVQYFPLYSILLETLPDFQVSILEFRTVKAMYKPDKLRFSSREFFSLSDAALAVLNESLDLPVQIRETPNLASIQFRPDQTFTIDELARYNRKNGNPAYVAVQGVVYDVTNNAAWAAATHFGLTAGRDLSSEFTSCHPGQPILSSLNIVGRMV